jgi:2-polyprenyl-3-methyl-5-hydroxy-6-metoxy-1,4-benzoquinol methylase
MNPAEDTARLQFASPRHVADLNECFFYHTMTLPTFGEVHGHWDLRGRFDDYIGGVDLKGKSFIDIGTATGFLSFEAEKNGAASVLSFDMAHARYQTFLPFNEKLSYRDPERWSEQHNTEVEQWKNAYWLCHRLLESKAKVYYGNVYKLPIELGQFDVAIIGSVLEHLSDPINALASISRLTKETIVIVSPVIGSEDRIARFEGLSANPQNDFTWWTYSTGLYREVLKMLGFTIIGITSSEYYYDYGQRNETRHTIVANRE